MAAKAGSHPGEVTEHTRARAHGKSLRSLHVCWNSQPAIEPRTLFSLWDKHVKRTYFGQTPAEQQQQREQLGYSHSVGLLLDWNSSLALEQTLRPDCAPRLCAPPVKAPRQSDRAPPTTHPPTSLPPSRRPFISTHHALTRASRRRGRGSRLNLHASIQAAAQVFFTPKC